MACQSVSNLAINAPFFTSGNFARRKTSGGDIAPEAAQHGLLVGLSDLAAVSFDDLYFRIRHVISLGRGDVWRD